MAVRLEEGMPPNLLARRQRLVERLIAASNGSGIAPNSRVERTLAREAWLLFGSWAKACHAAGLVTRYRYDQYGAWKTDRAPRQPGTVPPPAGCEDAARLAAMAVQFATEHGIGGQGSGETLLKIMRFMYQEGC